jgi:putative membrane protein
VLTLVVVGAIFAVVNTLVKPIVKLFSLPFYVLTLGLFAFIVNAFMLEIVSWLSGKLDISFHIDDFFWSAIGAAIVVTFVSMVLNLVLPDGD